MTTETPTPATQRAAEALRAGAGVTFPWAMSITPQMLAAALDGPADDEGMDDVTMAIHVAICEGSPQECVEWRGACAKGAEAVRGAVLGVAS